MKRGAFELSVTTIVIIVIAMVLLILGLFLVRKIMCGAMMIASETLEGARRQISSVFSEQAGEIRCMGSAGTNPITIVPDRLNVIGCLYSPDVSTTYILNITSAKFKPKGKPTETDAISWFTRTTHKKTVQAGDNDIGGVTVRPPKGTSAGTLIVEVKITKEGSNEVPYVDTLEFDVRSLGFLRETMC